MTELNSYISLGICFGRSFIALGAVLMHWAQFSWAQFYVGAILRGRNSTGAILRAQFYGRNSTGAILRAQFSVGAVLLGCSSTWAQFFGRSPTGAVLRGRNTTCTYIFTFLKVETKKLLLLFWYRIFKLFSCIYPGLQM